MSQHLGLLLPWSKLGSCDGVYDRIATGDTRVLVLIYNVVRTNKGVWPNFSSLFNLIFIIRFETFDK